ncbi:unnamed protein product [Cuscuta epithymum]|uniref:Replication protein A 70 kDa DNA-binding subunit B/D first OB fold domain-containing protein n=1 Tax=Cuscuta epithymum TaxID=186058 RepID=A0AAV0E4K3_9ASTE|nr:unnamed protein product [Cuscuta epithymum]
MIREVDHTRSIPTWALKVQVVRTFEMPHQCRGRERMETIFHDEEGDKIHAVIKRSFMHLYKSRLVENKCFRIKNFLVLDNYYTYKTTLHPYILEFIKKTTVFDHRSENFPNFVNNFHRHAAEPKGDK